VRVQRLALGDVTFPDWHPRVGEIGCPVFGYLIRHPDGVILFDTGVGTGNAFIDDLYRPTVISVVTALDRVGIDERDVVAVINSHLHFDHCGQNEVFRRRRVPIYAHAAEIEVAQTSGYTVPEWAYIADDLVRRVRGDEQVADGVRIIETPGHTPGHVSVVVETADGPVVIAGQCVYKTDEIVEQRVAEDNMHDDTFVEAGQQSLERLLSLAPREIVVAHDVRPWPPTEPTP
jgi:glyoxylase-like metal-dependent hydrolase (beta-lactamase superfamily II)